MYISIETEKFSVESFWSIHIYDTIRKQYVCVPRFPWDHFKKLKHIELVDLHEETPTNKTIRSDDNGPLSKRQETLTEMVVKKSFDSDDDIEVKDITGPIGKQWYVDIEPFEIIKNIGYQQTQWYQISTLLRNRNI